MINKEKLQWLKSEVEKNHFDSLAFGVLDLNSYEFETAQIGHRFEERKGEEAFFDLASLSKPLNFFPWLCEHPKLFTKERLLLLNHRGGLPVSGRLHRDTWKEQVLSYSINESETNYSDFSPLRLMLELEKESSKKTQDIVKKYWDKDLTYWRDLSPQHFVIPTGDRGSNLISGDVHDDKAFIIRDYTSHAGVFATISGVMRTLSSWCKDYQLVEKITSEISENRFSLGWDTVKDQKTSLAGSKSCLKTFGHLGFTGTSMWISPQNNKAIVILTNETLGYWYDRKNLASFRREIHNFLW